MQTQAILFSEEELNLSAYRLRYKDRPHVVVVGTAPPEEIDSRLLGIFEGGGAATLPPEIILTLNQRGEAARRLGPWLEGHYRPGRPI